MSAERLNVRDMTVMAVFAAALAVMSQISIPMPSGVPITLQTFALALIGYSLGAKRGAMAVLVYLLLGAVGVPVFANFHGGAAVFFGVTGGFLWTFWVTALFCGLKRNAGPGQAIASGLIGMILMYAVGLAQFMVLTGTGFKEALMLCVAPFIIKDLISLVLAYGIAKTVRRRVGL